MNRLASSTNEKRSGFYIVFKGDGEGSFLGLDSRVEEGNGWRGKLGKYGLDG